ncbi:MAG: phosphomevalonate kinase [Candidatus Azotimanducaceae bacterium]
MNFQAPGKVVVWGEYAVLEGAPACVMAIDRYANVSVQRAENIQLSASGFQSDPVTKTDPGWSRAPVAQLTETILSAWGYSQYPEGVQIHQDSSAFHDARGRKLGIGSSAAVCVALYRGLAELLNKKTSLAEAIELHRAFQQGSGSGLDVAASWLGGTIRFQQGDAVAKTWPDDLNFCVVFTGQSASTYAQVHAFSSWREKADTHTLAELVACSQALDEKFTYQKLERYIHQLRQLDRAAKLNIFTPEHEALSDLAQRCEIIYKPCGAGGGDIGMAFAQTSSGNESLARFKSLAREKFDVLDVNIAKPHRLN